MFLEFGKSLLDALRAKPYWPLIRPVYTLVALYVVTTVLAYQYIEWRYRFTPEFTTFLHSYLVKQISVAFLALTLIALILGTHWKAKARAEVAKRIGGWIRVGTWNLIIAGTILVLAGTAFLHFVPRRVSHITVRLLETPVSFDKYALAYLVYELNRFQTAWHFTLNLDTYNRNELPSTADPRCVADSLCLANLVASNQPFIGITESGFAQDHFWVNSDSGIVSVISAGDWKPYAPPSIYEYLSYTLIVQSTIIHLKHNCTGTPTEAFESSRVSYGDLFEFSAKRNDMKAAVLVAHLSPQGQELLANCFGLEYMNDCDRLLSLDWLRIGRVHDNLERVFGVKL